VQDHFAHLILARTFNLVFGLADGAGAIDGDAGDVAGEAPRAGEIGRAAAGRSVAANIRIDRFMGSP
jgi:hypothetical protein